MPTKTEKYLKLEKEEKSEPREFNNSFEESYQNDYEEFVEGGFCPAHKYDRDHGFEFGVFNDL